MRLEVPPSSNSKPWHPLRGRPSSPLTFAEHHVPDQPRIQRSSDARAPACVALQICERGLSVADYASSLSRESVRRGGRRRLRRWWSRTLCGRSRRRAPSAARSRAGTDARRVLYGLVEGQPDDGVGNGGFVATDTGRRPDATEGTEEGTGPPAHRVIPDERMHGVVGVVTQQREQGTGRYVDVSCRAVANHRAPSRGHVAPRGSVVGPPSPPRRRLVKRKACRSRRCSWRSARSPLWFPGAASVLTAVGVSAARHPKPGPARVPAHVRAVRTPPTWPARQTRRRRRPGSDITARSDPGGGGGNGRCRLRGRW
jgi:hypothetical protein